MKKKASKTLGERIRLIRGDLSQIEFAEIVGIRQAMVSRYEAGKETPSPPVLLRISRYHGCSIEWLLTGEGKLTGRRESRADLIDQAAKYVRKAGLPDNKEFADMMKYLFQDREMMRKVLQHYRFLKK
jgi:transcriptional regulator with XRE-family HTH domain